MRSLVSENVNPQLHSQITSFIDIAGPAAVCGRLGNDTGDCWAASDVDFLATPPAAPSAAAVAAAGVWLPCNAFSRVVQFPSLTSEFP